MARAPDLTDRLAERLRAARRARDLSLDAVAKLSGVSRSMVSQIERGESSPTVATLWNLTQALGVDFAGLVTGRGGGGIAVTRAADAPVIDRAGGVRIRILSPPEAVGRHEVYDLDFSPGAALVSAAHGAGCREHLTVLDGRLTVEQGGETAALGPGDVARYAADTDHAIRANGAARAILIVQDSG